LPAKNDDAVALKSLGPCGELGLGGIPTMNDDAVCLMDRIG
jgi:hypothetical protein